MLNGHNTPRICQCYSYKSITISTLGVKFLEVLLNWLQQIDLEKIELPLGLEDEFIRSIVKVRDSVFVSLLSRLIFVFLNFVYCFRDNRLLEFVLHNNSLYTLPWLRGGGPWDPTSARVFNTFACSFSTVIFLLLSRHTRDCAFWSEKQSQLTRRFPAN